MGRTLDFAVALASVALIIGAIVVLVRHVWRKLPDAPAPEPEPLPTFRQATCDYCEEKPTRYRPCIVEERRWIELLSRVLPIGLVVARLRRGTTWTAVPTLCELHGARGESAIDSYLAEEDAKLARAVELRAQRAQAFMAGLAKLLREG